MASFRLAHRAPCSFCHPAAGISEQLSKPKVSKVRQHPKSSSRSTAPSAPRLLLSKHLGIQRRHRRGRETYNLTPRNPAKWPTKFGPPKRGPAFSSQLLPCVQRDVRARVKVYSLQSLGVTQDFQQIHSSLVAESQGESPGKIKTSQLGLETSPGKHINFSKDVIRFKIVRRRVAWKG